MTDPVDLFPTSGAKFWRQEKLGTVRGISVDLASRSEHPNDLQVRLMSQDLDDLSVTVASLAANRMDDARQIGAAVLKALGAAEGAWFRVLP